MEHPIPEPTALAARLRAAGCVFAEDEAAMLHAAAGSAEELEAMVVRRIVGEPLEQVVGWAWFDGIRVRLRPGVFVPRLRTTAMVAVAAAQLRPGDVVIDLGCGSGAIGAAVAARVPGVEVWAVDVDPAAVACARLNLAPERVLLGDLFGPLPPGLRARVVCANAPYVPTDAIALMPSEAREHEHRVALDGGPDGLDVQRRVIAEAAAHLTEDGVLLVETSRAQAPATEALATAAGFAVRRHVDEEVDGTVVEARRHDGEGRRRDGSQEVVHPPQMDDLPLA
jgi:release factor glutamine methyltransferase